MGELNGCLTASNRFFTHCLSILDTGWQDSCLCASISWSLCACTRMHVCLCNRSGMANECYVACLTWVCCLRTPVSDPDIGPKGGIITKEFGQLWSKGNEGAGLMHCVKKKTCHTHLIWKNGLCVTQVHKMYHLERECSLSVRQL